MKHKRSPQKKRDAVKQAADRDRPKERARQKKIYDGNKQKERDTDDDDHEISFGSASEVFHSLLDSKLTKEDAKKIGTLKSNKQKEGDTEDETEDILDSKLKKDDAIVMNYDERDEAGPPGEADMEAPKGTGNTINTIMNDTPDVVSRYENKLDDEIIEDQNLISRKLERRKHLSGNLSISSDLHLELYLQWEQALDSPDFQSQTPLQDLNKDMEISVSLIGLEIIWVFKGGGIGTWWIGTLL